MECNKEEAIRAKGIAEKKMESKDFVGARKLALKAQQLYPDLENISQMIMVCDVHCSAENKTYGNEKDWHAVLQIEVTADEALIRKQYRKFALLLHPDKNKAAGAADAFKLIFEAQRVLLDHEKRMSFDNRYNKASGGYGTPHWTTQQVSGQSNVVKQPSVQNNFSYNVSSQFTNQSHQPPQQPTQSGVFNRPTFWTMCPSCGVRYQYYKDVMNKLLLCQSCKKSFKGYEIRPQGATLQTKCSKPAFSKQQEFKNKDPVEMEARSGFGNCAKVRAERGVCSENPAMDSFANIGCSCKVSGESRPNARVDKEGQSGGLKPCKKTNGRKRKKWACEFGDSCDTGSSSNLEEDTVNEETGDHLSRQNSGCCPEKYPRRSTRSKQHVSYNENLREGVGLSNLSKRVQSEGYCPASVQVEDASPKKEACNVSKSAGLGADLEKDEKSVNEDERYSHAESLQNGEEKTKVRSEKRTSLGDEKKTSNNNLISQSNSSPTTLTEPEVHSCIDPEFSDFDSDRKFATNQIWAAYDTLDAMPRFYARIRKVLSSGFKIQITWLEPDPDPDNTNEIKWVDEGLPVACGKFRHGNSEYTEDYLMFSHLVSWEKGSGRDRFVIFPRKGETWALFKNWDINWRSDLDSRRNLEFEFVEVLSDYADSVGVHVAYLSKIKGFACLFGHTKVEEMDSVLISPQELFRFSHRVPSFQMTGLERIGVPKGSFELDPASLPAYLEAIVSPEILKMETTKVPIEEAEGGPSINQSTQMTHLSPSCYNPENASKVCDGAPVSPETHEIPEPEFYNFDADKSKEKFQVGQFWALYSEEDGLPKYYGRIKKVDYQPEFKLHLNWLCSCSPPKDMIKFLDKTMLVSCGRFTVQRGKTQEFTETGAFSHQIRAEQMRTRDTYVIYPMKSDVWALYENWNAEMTCSNLKNCKYDIVEVVDENDLWISVLFLELVCGFSSVFKPKMRRRSNVIVKIPSVELLRFSHQIPAFRLTEERGGNLQGFWELDTAALPVHLFNKS